MRKAGDMMGKAGDIAMARLVLGRTRRSLCKGSNSLFNFADDFVHVGNDAGHFFFATNAVGRILFLHASFVPCRRSRDKT